MSPSQTWIPAPGSRWIPYWRITWTKKLSLSLHKRKTRSRIFPVSFIHYIKAVSPAGDGKIISLGGIPLPAHSFFTLVSFVSPQPCLQLSLMPCIMADQRFEFIRSGTHIPERDLGAGSLRCVMPGRLRAGSSPHTLASGILSCAGEIFARIASARTG